MKQRAIPGCTSFSCPKHAACSNAQRRSLPQFSLPITARLSVNLLFQSTRLDCNILTDSTYRSIRTSPLRELHEYFRFSPIFLCVLFHVRMQLVFCTLLFCTASYTACCTPHSCATTTLRCLSGRTPPLLFGVTSSISSFRQHLPRYAVWGPHPSRI